MALPNSISSEFWQALNGLKSTQPYRAGLRLFQQGEPARRIYIVETGEVRLLMHSGARERLFDTVGPEAMLAVSEVLTGESYKVSADTAMACQISFIERDVWLEFVRENHNFCLDIVRLLSDDLHRLHDRFRVLAGEGKRGKKR